MKNESRKHHYISQFYLKGFGKTGFKNPPITVINLPDKQVARAKARKKYI